MDAFLEGISKVIIGPLAMFSPENEERREEIENWSRRNFGNGQEKS